jgi:hypothetical protein
MKEFQMYKTNIIIINARHQIITANNNLNSNGGQYCLPQPMPTFNTQKR